MENRQNQRPLTLSSLRYTQQQVRPDHKGTLADVFALRWLEDEHKITRERALQCVAFGVSEELGINGFLLDELRRSLVVLICNPSKYVSDFAEPLERFCSHGLPALFAAADDQEAAHFDTQQAGAESRRFIKHFQAVIEESGAVLESIAFRLIFFGAPEAAAKSAVIANFEEDVQHQRHFLERRLGRSDIQVTSAIKSADGATTIPDKLKGFTQVIAMANHVSMSGPGNELMHIGGVSLWELHQIYRRLRTRFLSRNVRAALSTTTGSNQALLRAFRDVATGLAPPEHFMFRHNGVTLTASACRVTGQGLELIEPQLLNGAQTVTTLDAAVSELETQKMLSSAVTSRLSRLLVIGRVISNCDRDFVTSVTIASNRQNPIMPWHLRAHDDIQSRLQSWFLDTLGLYYEVQEKAFQSMTEDEREEVGVLETDKYLEIRTLAKTFLASDGLIDLMQQSRAVFDDDELYRKAFHKGRLTATPEDVIFCYKIERRIRKMLGILSVSDKYAFAKSGRSLIWALLCQAYLNSRQHNQLARAEGRSLVATEEFTSTLEAFAVNKVRPLLIWIANHSEYVDDVRRERYAFLSTRKCYERVMAIGREKFGWESRRLGTRYPQ